MLRSEVPDNEHVFAAAQRFFTRETTPEERKRVWKAARKIHREQKAGRSFTMREFCLRLLTEGLRLPPDQAAAITNQALNSAELPRELQQSMT